jgi:hypothetical protein
VTGIAIYVGIVGIFFCVIRLCIYRINVRRLVCRSRRSVLGDWYRLPGYGLWFIERDEMGMDNYHHIPHTTFSVKVISPLKVTLVVTIPLVSKVINYIIEYWKKEEITMVRVKAQKQVRVLI